jgi:hypothetical protein
MALIRLHIEHLTCSSVDLMTQNLKEASYL